jgi:hypothetical protein
MTLVDRVTYGKRRLHQREVPLPRMHDDCGGQDEEAAATVTAT